MDDFDSTLLDPDMDACSACGVAWPSHDSLCPTYPRLAKAAAALGRRGGKAGTGEAKRRGDSAYYKALRAKRNVKAGGGLGGGA